MDLDRLLWSASGEPNEPGDVVEVLVGNAGQCGGELIVGDDLLTPARVRSAETTERVTVKVALISTVENRKDKKNQLPGQDLNLE